MQLAGSAFAPSEGGSRTGPGPLTIVRASAPLPREPAAQLGRYPGTAGGLLPSRSRPSPPPKSESLARGLAGPGAFFVSPSGSPRRIVCEAQVPRAAPIVVRGWCVSSAAIVSGALLSAVCPEIERQRFGESAGRSGTTSPFAVPPGTISGRRAASPRAFLVPGRAVDTPPRTPELTGHCAPPAGSRGRRAVHDGGARGIDRFCSAIPSLSGEGEGEHLCESRL
jgi:hypothetical protein